MKQIAAETQTWGGWWIATAPTCFVSKAAKAEHDREVCKQLLARAEAHLQQLDKTKWQAIRDMQEHEVRLKEALRLYDLHLDQFSDEEIEDIDVIDLPGMMPFIIHVQESQRAIERAKRLYITTESDYRVTEDTVRNLRASTKEDEYTKILVEYDQKVGSRSSGKDAMRDAVKAAKAKEQIQSEADVKTAMIPKTLPELEDADSSSLVHESVKKLLGSRPRRGRAQEKHTKTLLPRGQETDPSPPGSPPGGELLLADPMSRR